MTTTLKIGVTGQLLNVSDLNDLAVNVAVCNMFKVEQQHLETILEEPIKIELPSGFVKENIQSN